jgi:hypothetical protein
MDAKPSFQARLRKLAVNLSTIHIDSILQQYIKRKYPRYHPLVLEVPILVLLGILLK